MSHNSRMQTNMRNLVFLVISLLLFACATTKPADDAFTSAESAIEVAIQAGAEEHSPVELRFAREKLAEAHKGMEYKQFDKAIYLIDQSEINSELALAKTRAAIIRGKVTDLARENEILREEFESTFGEKLE